MPKRGASASRAPATELETFARFCAALTLEQGTPLVLEPFQRAMLRDYFAGAVETLALLPKKNGKTTLLAALALYHLVVTPDAECVIAAASRDQATILYDQARGFVRRSIRLQQRVEIKRGFRELRSTRDDGRIRVLAADVDTADGVIPTLAIVDEQHRARSAELYGVFRDGLGPRAGQMLTISAAGEHEQTPLGLMRAAARKLDGKHDGAYLYARSDSGAFVLHEWALDDEADLHDMAVVKLANPASWQTEQLLKQRHDSPSMLPWQWARFACGIWVGAELWWIRADEWDAAVTTEQELQPGDAIALGFDGSRVADATALVACRMSDGLVQPLAVWEQPPYATDWEVPAHEVDGAIGDAFEQYRVVRAYFDPPLWQSEVDEWASRYGEAVVLRYHTNRARMMHAVERFRTDLLARRFEHTGDVELRRHVLNAQIRERRGGYWLTKTRPASPDKIDLAVAAVLAYEARADALTVAEKPEPSRELLTF